MVDNNFFEVNKKLLIDNQEKTIINKPIRKL